MKIKFLKKEASKGFYYLANINRQVNPSHVTKLAESIQMIGVIRPIVVSSISFLTGKTEKYIIDGQHLFNALLRLGLDIPYVEIEIKSKEELIQKIALLNASSKSWQLVDYITAWSSLKEDYVTLNKYFNVYDIELRALSNILEGSDVNNGKITPKIKKGTFTVRDEAAAKIILDMVTDVLKVIPRVGRHDNRYTVSEFVDFYRKNRTSYDHKKFINGLKKSKNDFLLATQEPGKLVELFEKLC